MAQDNWAHSAQARLGLTCSKEPKHAAWSDGQPAQSLHRLLLGVWQARLWCHYGVTMVSLWSWAPASLDLHITLSPRVSPLPMSAAGIKLGGAVGFFKGKGTSG